MNFLVQYWRRRCQVEEAVMFTRSILPQRRSRNVANRCSKLTWLSRCVAVSHVVWLNKPWWKNYVAFANSYCFDVASVSILSHSVNVFKNQIEITTFSVKRKNVACSDLSKPEMDICLKRVWIFNWKREGNFSTGKIISRQFYPNFDRRILKKSW